MRTTTKRLYSEHTRYDANGNRAMTDYVTGVNNQTTADPRYDYEFDAEGNRTRKTDKASGEVTEYTWDYRNRLTRITRLDSLGGSVLQTVDYVYDVFDRRISKAIDSDGDGTVDERSYVIHDGLRSERDNAGDHRALELDENGQVTGRFLFGPYVDQILAEEQIDPSTGAADTLCRLRTSRGAFGTWSTTMTYSALQRLRATSPTTPSAR